MSRPLKKLIEKLKKRKTGTGVSAEAKRSESSLPNGGNGQEDENALLLQVFRFSVWVQLQFQPIARKLDWSLVRALGLILALSFVAASSVSTFAVSVLMSGSGSADGKHQVEALRIVGDVKAVDDSGPGLASLTRTILNRNLFNSAGELAPENEEVETESTQTSDLDFESVPCSKEKPPVAVLGTIFTGDPFNSYVTVKDSKVSYADTYKVGSMVIDYEDYEVYKVLRDKVEFRKGDQKICATLDVIGESQNASADAPEQRTQPDQVVNLQFEAEELADGIGPGYANILNSAKLIPALEGGSVVGFKLIAIKPDSLFRKMKLQNQDVITEVNGVSLKDASEGFKLYQALQEEREINMKVVRGDQVMTYIVRVK